MLTVPLLGYLQQDFETVNITGNDAGTTAVELSVDATTVTMPASAG